MKLRFNANVTARRAIILAGAVVDQEETGWSEAELASAIESGSCDVVLDDEERDEEDDDSDEDEGEEDEGDDEGDGEQE